MPNKAKEQHYRECENFVTLAEACRITRKPYHTVIYAIDAGNVAAVKCGRNWIVHVVSLTDWFNRHTSN